MSPRTGPASSRAEVEARLRAARDRTAALGVRSLRLFGSAARDQLGEASDVDILVEFRGPPSFRAL